MSDKKPNYTPRTQAKINFLAKTIERNPEWGSTRLQKAIKAEFGTQLKKDYLLREAAAYRVSQKIEQPKMVRKDYDKLRSVLSQGAYTDFEKAQFWKQVREYTPEGRANFVRSETLKQTAADHRAWFEKLVSEARANVANLTIARQVVYEKLAALHKAGEYDPFKLLKEQEKDGVVLSGMIRIRKLRRDYTETRRKQAAAHQKQVQQKVLEFRY